MFFFHFFFLSKYVFLFFFFLSFSCSLQALLGHAYGKPILMTPFIYTSIFPFYMSALTFFTKIPFSKLFSLNIKKKKEIHFCKGFFAKRRYSAKSKTESANSKAQFTFFLITCIQAGPIYKCLVCSSLTSTRKLLH